MQRTDKLHKENNMDFGDILNKWEKSKNGSSQTQTSVMGDQDNDIYGKDNDYDDSRKIKAERRRKLRSAKPDDILDIHGFTRDEAWKALETFINNAKENDMKKVRIIHGKGNHSQDESVLRITVREFLEQCKFTGENGYEKAIEGGSGATWVLIK